MWKGEHFGREVAVKVLRTYSNSELQKIIGVSCWLRSLALCQSTDGALCVEVLQGGRHLENPPTPKCRAINWSYDVRQSVCDDIWLDDERRHKHVPKSKSWCGPVKTCMFSVHSLAVFALHLWMIE